MLEESSKDLLNIQKQSIFGSRLRNFRITFSLHSLFALLWCVSYVWRVWVSMLSIFHILFFILQILHSMQFWELRILLRKLMKKNLFSNSEQQKYFLFFASINWIIFSVQTFIFLLFLYRKIFMLLWTIFWKFPFLFFFERSRNISMFMFWI